MFCNRCGTQNPDGAAFCAKCGAHLQQPPQQSQWNQPPKQPQWNQQPQWNPPPKQPQWNQQPQQPWQAQGAIPMNWHKFLIFFALWAGGILNILTGLLMMTGAQYEAFGDVSSDLVYMVFPSLKTCDMLFGLLFMAFGAFQIYTRFLLAGFRRKGPQMLLTTYVSGLAVSILYLIIVAAIVSDATGGGTNLSGTFSSSSSMGVVTCAVMVIINQIYYKKRAFLFVN